MSVSSEWVRRMRDVPVEQVARRLSYAVGERQSAWHIAPCPECGEQRRRGAKKRADKRGAVGSPKRAPAAWQCHACGAEGDTLHFVALALVERRMGALDERQRAEVRAWCERFLGLDGSEPIYRPESPRSAAPSYPPADELAQLWDELCGPVTSDPQLCAWLAGRHVDPEIVAERDLARALPRGAAGVSPRWAGFEPEGRPWRGWAEAGYRLILPLYDVRGRLRNVIARTPRPNAQIKSVSATGHDRSALLLADALGREVLARGRAPEALGERPRLVIAEGEMDLLCWGTEPSIGAIATWGIISGSWTRPIARRIPSHTTVVIATDADEGGDGYAESIARSLSRRRTLSLERWRPSHGEDAGDVREAGGALRPAGEPLEAAGKAQGAGVPEEPSGPEKPARQRGKPGGEVDDDEAFLAGIGAGPSVGAGRPLSAVRAFQKAPIAPEVQVPFGYQVTAQGAVWTDPPEGSKKGPRKIASRVPLLRRVLFDPSTKEERLEVTFRRRSSWRSAIIDRAIISVGGRDTARALGAVGAPVEPRTSRDVAQWVASLEAENERTLPYALVTSRSGWHELEDGRRVFLLGGTAIDGAGESDAVVFDDRVDAAGVARNIRAKGDAAEQLHVVRRAMAASDALACGVYAALAAPLLERVGAPCFVYHFVGPSSRGKTTALGVSAGLYGSPEVRAGLGWVSSWDQTSVGLEHRASLSSDLPLCLDDALMNGAASEHREQDVYMLVSGQGRTRGAARGGLRPMQAWRTIVVSTGEGELIRTERSRAGAQVRAVQVRLDGLGELTGADVAELGAQSRQHYGHLGRRFIEMLVGLEDFEPLRLRYGELERHYRELLGKRSSLEQRQAEAFAVLALAEELGHEWLRLQAPGAVDRLAGDADARVAVVPEWHRALTVVAEWLASEPGAWPRVELDTFGRKQIQYRNDGGGPRPAARFAGFQDRIPVDGHARDVLYVVPELLSERLEARGLSVSTIAREWRREGILVPDRTGSTLRLKHRVRMAGARPWFYVLDLSAMDGGGITPSSSDPGSDPSSPDRNPPESQTSFEGGITGIGGITTNEPHPRAHAGAHANAGARARVGNRELSDPSDPTPKETNDDEHLTRDHCRDHLGSLDTGVIPGASAPGDDFAAQFEDDW